MAPLVLHQTSLNLLGQFLALGILAVGMDLIWGYAGILSLGQGVFFGIGGYLAAMYLKLQGLAPGTLPDFMSWSGVTTLPLLWRPFESFSLTLLMILTVPGLLAYLFAVVVFRSRIRGVYFSIITQALAVAASTLVVDQQQFTGGSSGLTGFGSIFGHSFYARGTQVAMYELTVCILAAVFALAWILTRSNFGVLLRAVRDGENRLRFLGYNPTTFKAFVFGLAGLCAGLAGALYVPQNGIIAPGMLGVVPSIEMVIWVAVGGRGTISGALAGALVVNYAKYYLSSAYPDIWLFLVGAMFVIVVLFFPRGLMGLVDLARRRTGRSRP
ncbi:MAG: urea ABC transporter permease subunit UrtC [Chromatiales bacterium 21-64-14]|nr:MAG: urea ABC transporter permease subunit UrtC [Chromatiales bacterium 21-64-14]